MTHFQHRLNPWVAYGILPVFAFANAGIPLVDGFGEAMRSPVTWGVIAGLTLGQADRDYAFRLAGGPARHREAARRIAWRHIVGVACLGGVGFTISLFITDLAFGAGTLANHARVGIFIGSLISGLVAYLFLRNTLPPPRAA